MLGRSICVPKLRGYHMPTHATRYPADEPLWSGYSGVGATAIQRVQPVARSHREGCWVENRRAELQQAEPRNAAGDDSARFLRELRQLRGGAGLGHAELAARAHYPCDAIRAAEAGPSLPDLPVLSAYVRGCGGTLAEWEERWRQLTRSPALPLLPVRPAGSSDAATAGARVGSTSLAADGHDPHVIMAALGRVADGMAATAQAGSPVAEARRSKPPIAAAPRAIPMAAAAGPEAAAPSVAPG